ncbi:Beta-D-xylosidase 3 [Folsomia candida]|uniref:Beta-D-xylosidase 3 n=1 Tax=Folsomia candida TaxID=158441 RepID=A0A226EB35_FOLCA|nr:Beta-D-xylosidase 3 [Folsomia candida]
MGNIDWTRTAFVLVGLFTTCLSQQYTSQCDKTRNAQLPFCDSSLSIEARVADLIGRLTVEEKIGWMVHDAKGASQNVDLDDYYWWNEGLKGIGGGPQSPEYGARFRPPTEYATVFPQPINLASSFNKDLFLAVGNATGNEARAFFNVGNGGLTYWSPNSNIYRDPRWGRGHETPGEDPRLSIEFAKGIVLGLQGDQANGFLKNSACCKHFSAHSLENDRFTFNAVVNEQDMADTYMPVFKSCVQESDVSCIMCAYNAVNGVPACADKGMLTGTIRQEWGFSGYVVSDCGAVSYVHTRHNYTEFPSQSVAAVLDAGVDVECFVSNTSYYSSYLQEALNEDLVNQGMLDLALEHAFGVLMRLRYFEKNVTRPFTDLLPEIVDSEPHRELSLTAARQSIPTITVFRPIKTPLEEIRLRVPSVQYEFGCDLVSFDNLRLEEAAALARVSLPVILFVGIAGGHNGVEYEEHDRANLTLPGLQSDLIRVVLTASTEPVVLVVVSGGVVDLSEWKDDPRVGAIIWAGYLGQSGGEAIAEVIFGEYNPSGRLAQTFYSNEVINEFEKYDMNMRPHAGSLGRTYRFYTGQPVYPFGFGLSYTAFEYTILNPPAFVLKTISQNALDQDCALIINLSVRNIGARGAEHSVLWFVSPPSAGQMGRPIKSLLDFEKLDYILPNMVRQISLCLNRNHFLLANDAGEFEVLLNRNRRSPYFTNWVYTNNRNFLSGIDIIYGNESSQIPPDNIAEVTGKTADINAGFGGDYVWLVPEWSSRLDEGVTSLRIDVQEKEDQVSKNLAKGAGGLFRYLRVIRDISHKEKIIEVALVRKDNEIVADSYWEECTQDINKYRMKDYLYLCWRSVTP